MFKAVLFDLDGTLLDSLQDLTDCANKVLSANDLPTHNADTVKGYVGEGVRLLVERFLPESHKQEAIVDQVLAEFRDCYRLNYATKTRPYPGINEMLDGVEERGLKTAVFSNKPHDLTKDCVDDLLNTRKFDVVLGATSGIPRKPDPAGAYHIANQLGVRSNECLFLGDSETDMETANRAGMHAVGALWGFRSKEELLKAGAKKLIDKPQELLSII